MHSRRLIGPVLSCNVTIKEILKKNDNRVEQAERATSGQAPCTDYSNAYFVTRYITNETGQSPPLHGRLESNNAKRGCSEKFVFNNASMHYFEQLRFISIV